MSGKTYIAIDLKSFYGLTIPFDDILSISTTDDRRLTYEENP